MIVNSLFSISKHPGLLLFLAISLQACQRPAAVTPLKVSWKLEKNFEQNRQDVHKSIFTLTNTSRAALGDNWALYWNQAPRVIIEIDSSAKVAIRNINGDLYEMKALPGFSLGPRQSVVIKVLSEEWMIKEADAPVGLYQVFRENGEDSIRPVSDYAVEAFTKLAQLTRSREDAAPIPTAEYLYVENQKVSLLPAEQLYPFIPSPASARRRPGGFTFPGNVSVAAAKELEKEAGFLIAALNERYKARASVANGPSSQPAIRLSLDSSLEKAESYRLKVSGESIEIAGKDAAGAFYGVQSLLALIEDVGGKAFVPAYEITDYPAYPYRGFHIDVGRNFQSKETILRVVDLLARYKINKLLLYVTEDEGWRLEIEELPELTLVGARRGHTLGDSLFLQPAYGSGPYPDAPDSYGNGYYSREDFKEIIRYAYGRHIEAIPSANLPAHARAAIKAMEYRYRRLMAEGKPEEARRYRLIDPEDASAYRSAQYYTDNVACVCQDQAYDFYETVLDDIIEMYEEAGVPLRMIHTGGDEVPSGAWAGSPVCRKYLQAYPEIQGPQNLQAHFFGRLTKMIASKGLQIGGWEEVVMDYDENGSWVVNTAYTGRQVYPYIWNNLWGQQDLGYRIANRGYPVILCPVTNFYFDLAYDKDPREPGLYWAGFNDTRDAFDCVPGNLFLSTKEDDMGRPFDPETDFAGMERLTAVGRKNIVGLQSQLWSETVRGREMLEHYILPKLPGFAQRAWQGDPAWAQESDAAQRNALSDADWNRFINTVAQREFPELDQLNGGYRYRIPAPGIVVKQDTVYMNTAYPGLEIRYTTDGSEPGGSSPIYEGPFAANGKVMAARCFNVKGRGGLTSYVTN